jgi:phospholipid/cholesterol/gamma-HCH transport system substrate-binding protein
MMKPLSARDPFRIGVIAIACGAVIGLVILVLSVVSFGTTSYTAVLEHTAGLRKGEDVQVHGVSVGRITGIDLEDKHVLVTFVVDDEIDLGSKTTAEVKVATLLGTHYLEVTPHGSGELADDRIPLERTSVPYNLQDVLEGGTKNLEALDADMLAEALTAVSETLSASTGDIGPALTGVARLSEVVTTRSSQVGALLKAARSVTDQLSDSSDDIVGLMEQTNLVVSEVTARREAIHRLLVETTVLSEALTAIVTQTQEDLKPALKDVNLALASLNKEDDALKKVLSVMAPAVRYVANATGNGPFVDLYGDDPAIPADDALCAAKVIC